MTATPFHDSTGFPMLGIQPWEQGQASYNGRSKDSGIGGGNMKEAEPKGLRAGEATHRAAWSKEEEEQDPVKSDGRHPEVESREPIQERSKESYGNSASPCSLITGEEAMDQTP
ncbi:hypothetical protein NDU88_004676 [Pleurodeles waltl]|uniref:Uncharacterized protein n=1 Tax=Pleurodeles waltl TaxID=8319 RepID=A0AAV7SJM6_PLEWA|nr:hypothetical protein NDU88_004676 [Pleurodeles waltl]